MTLNAGNVILPNAIVLGTVTTPPVNQGTAPFRALDKNSQHFCSPRTPDAVLDFRAVTYISCWPIIKVFNIKLNLLRWPIQTTKQQSLLRCHNMLY